MNAIYSSRKRTNLIIRALCFGAAAFGATYGAAATVIQFTSAFGPALFGFLRDGFGGYGPGLAIAAGVTMIGCLALLIGGVIGKRRRETV